MENFEMEKLNLNKNIEILKKLWINERFSPEPLLYHKDLVDQIKLQINLQV